MVLKFQNPSAKIQLNKTLGLGVSKVGISKK